MLLGAYWGVRRETKEGAAARVSAFLVELAGCSEALGSWFARGWSRSDALTVPIASDAASLASRFEINRRDSDGEPIPELGFGFGAWNGQDSSLSVTIGGWSRHVGNHVVLELGPEIQIGEDTCARMMQAIVQAFAPDHAVVKGDEHMRGVDAKVPWESGLLTYHRRVGTP